MRALSIALAAVHAATVVVVGYVVVVIQTAPFENQTEEDVRNLRLLLFPAGVACLAAVVLLAFVIQRRPGVATSAFAIELIVAGALLPAALASEHSAGKLLLGGVVLAASGLCAVVASFGSGSR